MPAGRKFCSRTCALLSRRIKTVGRSRTCSRCGSAFATSPRSTRKYCSPRCAHGGPQPSRRTGRDVSCAFCGTQFYATGERLNRSANLFCCIEHANLYQARNKANLECKVCGTRFRRSPAQQRKSKTIYCSLKCRDADPTVRIHLLRMNQMQQGKHPNKLESAGFAMLADMGLEFEAHPLFKGKFCVDALLEKSRIVVQFDGDYWHGNPAVFPDPSARQKKRIARDESQDAYMSACGYNVIRIWETDMKKRAGAVRERLTAAIVGATQQE